MNKFNTQDEQFVIVEIQSYAHVEPLLYLESCDSPTIKRTIAK